MKAVLIVSVLSLLPTLACTQEHEDTRSCRIIFPLGANDAPKSVFMVDGRQCRQIELPRWSFSEAIQLPQGELTLSFPDKQLDPGDPALKAAPSVLVTKETGDVYLVATYPAGDDGKPVLNFRLVNAGSDRFSKGQMIWLNLSEATVSGKVGTQNLDIEPGKEMVLDAPATDGSTYPVQLDFAHPQTKGQRPLLENQWRHDSKVRVLAIITADGKHVAPRVFSYSDSDKPKE